MYQSEERGTKLCVYYVEQTLPEFAVSKKVMYSEQGNSVFMLLLFPEKNEAQTRHVLLCSVLGWWAEATGRTAVGTTGNCR